MNKDNAKGRNSASPIDNNSRHHGIGESRRNSADRRLIQVGHTPDLTISRADVWTATTSEGLTGKYLLLPSFARGHCKCRKPGMALLDIAARALGFKTQDCFVIGDKECDIARGQRRTNADQMMCPDYIAVNLSQAATIIKQLLEQ